MTPFQTQAASGNYEAMLVNCIDPRFTTLSWQYMGLLQGIGREKLSDNYSQFVIAGGPIGAVHPKFSAWHKAYWDNLDITVSLHHIKRVVGITHRDCGAAKLAFGEDKVANKEIETESHAEALNEFRRQVQKRHPKLSVITGRYIGFKVAQVYDRSRHQPEVLGRVWTPIHRRERSPFYLQATSCMR
jgi:hypothetical protein